MLNYDCRQFVNFLTEIHETDFLVRFLFDESFFELICAASSAACLASFSAKEKTRFICDMMIDCELINIYGLNRAQ